MSEFEPAKKNLIMAIDQVEDALCHMGPDGARDWLLHYSMAETLKGLNILVQKLDSRIESVRLRKYEAMTPNG